MSASNTEKSMRTPLARARGLGSAKDGVHHWWIQRLTAVVLAVLTPWFLWELATLLPFQRGCEGDGVMVHCLGSPGVNLGSELAHPGRALPLLAFMLALFWHANLGLQVVIEDYVHTRWLEVTLQVLNSLACSLGALVSVFAIARIVFAH